MLAIGLMSGTSMDGIDAALINTDGTPNLLKEIGNISFSYTSQTKILLKAAEYTIRKCMGDVVKAHTHYDIEGYLRDELHISNSQSQITQLSTYLFGAEHSTKVISLTDIITHSTILHSVAVNQLLKVTGYDSYQIDVVGYHGQTMFHRPAQGISIILGDGAFLANQIGITVINDFRRQDMLLGGQGAPFAPLYHQALAIRDKKIPLAVVNCGGIANITLISSDREADLIAFDTGPGNGLIDKLIRQHSNGKEHMDTDGKYGKCGKVNPSVLEALYEQCIIHEGENYFMKRPPKSLDIGDMTLIPALLSLSLTDACRTLEAFTADSIIHSLSFVNLDVPNHWVLAGGGWHNPIILDEFKNRLHKKLGKKVDIKVANEIGWNSQALEAQIFAYLAVRSLQNKPLSFPGTTKVTKPTTGGQVHVPTVGLT